MLIVLIDVIPKTCNVSPIKPGGLIYRLAVQKVKVGA